MSSEQGETGEFLGFVALAAFGAFIWFLYVNGPVSWWFVGALVGALIAKAIGDQMRPAREAKTDAKPSLRESIRQQIADDAYSFLRNLTIGFGLVFLAQLVLQFLTWIDPNSFASLEQGLWEILLALKTIGNPWAILAIVGSGLAFGVLFRTWLPAIAAARLRKWAGTTCTILAAALTFSFVGERTAETKYPETTKGIRAEIVSRLETVANARREAAAYQWASAVLARDRETAQWDEAAGEFMADARAGCIQTEAQAKSTDEILRQRGEVVQVIGCDVDQLTTHALKILLPSADRDASVDDPMAWLSQMEAEKRAGAWLPESSTLLAWQPEQLEFDFKDKLTPMRRLRQLLAQAKAMSRDAEAARSAMRGGLLKIATRWVDEHLHLPGLSDRVADIVRDAALANMAREGDDRLRKRLGRLKTKDTSAVSENLFPDLPKSAFAAAGIVDKRQRTQKLAEFIQSEAPAREWLLNLWRKRGPEFDATLDAEVQAFKEREKNRAARAAEHEKAAREFQEWLKARPEPYKPHVL